MEGATLFGGAGLLSWTLARAPEVEAVAGTRYLEASLGLAFGTFTGMWAGTTKAFHRASKTLLSFQPSLKNKQFKLHYSLVSNAAPSGSCGVVVKLWKDGYAIQCQSPEQDGKPKSAVF